MGQHPTQHTLKIHYTNSFGFLFYLYLSAALPLLAFRLVVANGLPGISDACCYTFESWGGPSSSRVH